MGVIETTLTLFLLMGVGFFLKRMNMVGDHFQADLSAYVMKIALPLFILSGTMVDIPRDIYHLVLQMFLISIGYFVVAIILSKGVGGFFKLLHEHKGPYEFASIFSNIGFMGYPIVQMLLGDSAIIYVAIFNITFNIVMWSYGVSIFSGGFELKLNKILSPQLVAAVLGITMAFLGIELPALLKPFITTLGSTATPFAMIILGMMVSNIHYKEFFEDIRYFIMSGYRLIIMPAITYGLLYLLGFREEMLALPVILAGMPVATNGVVICLFYKKDVPTMAKIVVISTLLFLLMVPIYAIIF